jgi:hypothetical protein
VRPHLFTRRSKHQAVSYRYAVLRVEVLILLLGFDPDSTDLTDDGLVVGIGILAEP